MRLVNKLAREVCQAFASLEPKTKAAEMFISLPCLYTEEFPTDVQKQKQETA
jgi:hypothetical protein